MLIAICCHLSTRLS